MTSKTAQLSHRQKRAARPQFPQKHPPGIGFYPLIVLTLVLASNAAAQRYHVQPELRRMPNNLTECLACL
ncbi:hypothetical protein [Blastopirellula marina]|uniref:hypothetical protein n=1 Tax=Blastopirellula marina TaxID=124 RepID=UPI0011B0D338|nr:hypothetical protein [Blastopirellula marina]